MRLENLEPGFAGQVVNFVGDQTVVPGIFSEVAERFDRLLEKLFFVFVQAALPLAS